MSVSGQKNIPPFYQVIINILHLEKYSALYHLSMYFIVRGEKNSVLYEVSNVFLYIYVEARAWSKRGIHAMSA
jgi:hypothetical protein